MVKCIHCDFDEPFDLQHPINDGKDVCEYSESHWIRIIIGCGKYMATNFGTLEFQLFRGNLLVLQCPKCKQLTFQ